MQLHCKTAMNHRESTNRFAHFCLISWFVVGESRIRRADEGRKRAIDDENPAGPFVYGHCLLYSTPSLLAHVHIYIRAVTTEKGNCEGGTVLEKGEPPLPPLVAINT